MSIIKTALVAASLVAVVSTANAAGREELNTGIHGNTMTNSDSAISPAARASFAQAGAVRGGAQYSNPLLDMFHGQAVR